MRSIALSLSFAAALLAQGDSGRITGRVVDPSGAVVVGAQIAATEQDTGVAYKAVSSAAGVYALAFLPPGRKVWSFSWFTCAKPIRPTGGSFQ